MGAALLSLQTQYFTLTQNLPTLLLACGEQPQRDTVNTQYVASRRNYWNSINVIFHEDDPKVAAAVSQMHTAQTELKTALDNLNDLAKVIEAITVAVKVGTALAGLAG